MALEVVANTRQVGLAHASTGGAGRTRLELCHLAAGRLRLVLSLLGIDTVDRM